LIRLGDVRERVVLSCHAYVVPSFLPALATAARGGSLPGVTGFEGAGADAHGRGLRFSWQAGQSQVTVQPGPAVRSAAVFHGRLDYWTINLLRNHPAFHHRGMAGITEPDHWPLDHEPAPPAAAPAAGDKCPRCWTLLPVSRPRRQWCGTCGRHVRPLRFRRGDSWQHGGRRFRVRAAENRVVAPLQLGFGFESFRHPDVVATREALGLDDVLHPYRRAGEYQQQLALVHWCSAASPSAAPHPRGRRWSHRYHPAAEMVRLAQQRGASFFCTYKAIATVQLCAAMGWTARLVNAACGDNRIGKLTCGHMINEIWSNTYCKWYYSDSLLNLHAEREGMPLSCAELRAEFYRNRGRDVTFVWGVDRVAMPYDVHAMNHPQLHEWFVVYMYNAFFDTPPDGGVLYPLMMLRDNHNLGRSWRRDSGDGNVYIGQGNVIETDDPDRLNFPLNIVELMADIEGDTLRLNALTRTPGLKSLQARIGGGRWRRFWPGEMHQLAAGETTISLRSVNVMNVRGPVSSVTIAGSA
jgi:hypothetical protein